jgi:hypothetical protein
MDEPRGLDLAPYPSEDVMNQLILAAALVSVGAVPAAAQSGRIYAAGVAGVNAGARGAVDVGTVSTMGGLVGLRVTGAWSIEFEMDQGWGNSSERVFEGLLSAQLSGPGQPTPQELEQYGVFGRSVWSDSTGRGYAAHVVWKTREPGRVNAAVFGGVSWRNFNSRHAVTITHVGPGVTYPPGHQATTSSVSHRPRTGGGLTGGVMVPIRVAGQLTVAPEVRYHNGIFPNGARYNVFQLGTRLMWGF